jgi:thymidine phosphorylase
MDVKTGGGAFMKTQRQATQLAESLVRVGRQAGLPTTAILSDMDQPLGQSVGNAIEINESVAVLQGQRGEVRDLTIELCAELLMQARVAKTLGDARVRLGRAIDDGRAMERFERMVHAQGGRLNYPLELAPETELVAQRSGFLARYDCVTIGEAVVAMGGGRRKKGDCIDHRVGIKIHRRVGDRVNKGQPILTLHGHSGQASDYLMALGTAVEISETQVPRRPLILERFGPQDQGQQSQQQ